MGRRHYVFVLSVRGCASVRASGILDRLTVDLQFPFAATHNESKLRSAGCRQLFLQRHRRSMFGRRAFSVADPAAWNSLPDYLRDPSRSFDSFRRDLKTFLFSFY